MPNQAIRLNHDTISHIRGEKVIAGKINNISLPLKRPFLYFTEEEEWLTIFILLGYEIFPIFLFSTSHADSQYVPVQYRNIRQ